MSIFRKLLARIELTIEDVIIVAAMTLCAAAFIDELIRWIEHY